MWDHRGGWALTDLYASPECQEFREDVFIAGSWPTIWGPRSPGGCRGWMPGSFLRWLQRLKPSTFYLPVWEPLPFSILSPVPAMPPLHALLQQSRNWRLGGQTDPVFSSGVE
jgi:hypothetical protein